MVYTSCRGEKPRLGRMTARAAIFLAALALWAGLASSRAALADDALFRKSVLTSEPSGRWGKEGVGASISAEVHPYMAEAL